MLYDEYVSHAQMERLEKVEDSLKRSEFIGVGVLNDVEFMDFKTKNMDTIRITANYGKSDGGFFTIETVKKFKQPENNGMTSDNVDNILDEIIIDLILEYASKNNPYDE